MGNMSLRNIPEDIHTAIKERALANNRSAEAEVRAIVEEAVRSADVGGFGTRIRKHFSGIEGNELEVLRNADHPEAATFE